MHSSCCDDGLSSKMCRAHNARGFVVGLQMYAIQSLHVFLPAYKRWASSV